MKNNSTKNRILKMIRPHIKLIIILSIIAVLIDIGEIIKPYIVKTVIDDYLSFGIFEKENINVLTLGIFYLLIVVFGNIAEYIVKILTTRMGERVVYEMRNKIYKYIEYSNISFHDKTSSGKLFVRLTSDVEDISALFKDVITTFIKDVVLIISLLAMMVYISYKLCLVSIVIVPLIVISSAIMTSMLNKIYEESKTLRTKLNTFFAESIYGLKVIKIFNRQYEKKQECKKVNGDLLKSIKRARIIESLFPAIMMIIEYFGISLIIYVCLKKVFGIDINVGVIYMFITYIQHIFEPINRIIDNIELIGEAKASLDKIYDLLEHDEYIENMEDGIVFENIRGKIEFKNVWFAYEKDNWILKDVSFNIEPGQSIALVGKTGSRKDYNNQFN